MEIAVDEAKLVLDVAGDSSTIKKLGQALIIENRLENVCTRIQEYKIGI